MNLHPIKVVTQEVRSPSYFLGIQTFTLNNRAAQSVGWGEGSQQLRTSNCICFEFHLIPTFWIYIIAEADDAVKLILQHC